MNKGWYWDDVTRKLYRWETLIKLLRSREKDTRKLFKKES